MNYKDILDSSKSNKNIIQIQNIFISALSLEEILKVINTDNNNTINTDLVDKLDSLCTNYYLSTKMLRTILSGMSHDLMNILHTLKAMKHIIGDEFKKDLNDYIDSIDISSRALISTNLKEVSRLDFINIFSSYSKQYFDNIEIDFELNNLFKADIERIKRSLDIIMNSLNKSEKFSIKFRNIDENLILSFNIPEFNILNVLDLDRVTKINDVPFIRLVCDRFIVNSEGIFILWK
jgi:hypothetical protein